MDLSGTVFVVTGAGSGIGRALAQRLAREGARLALADRDPATLAATAQMVEGAEVLTSVFDVSEAEAFDAFASEVQARFGRVDGLVNNAGVALTGMFHRMAPAAFDRVIKVNFDSVVYGSRAFLPMLSEAPAAWLVNLSSSFGLVGVPGHTAYCASKFAVRGFTEALEFEFSLTRPRIKVIGVYPAGIRTNLIDNAQADGARLDGEKVDGSGASRKAATKIADTLTEPPSTVADAILNAMRDGERRVLVGPGAEETDELVRAHPETYRDYLKDHVLT